MIATAIANANLITMTYILETLIASLRVLCLSVTAFFFEKVNWVFIDITVAVIVTVIIAVTVTVTVLLLLLLIPDTHPQKWPRGSTMWEPYKHEYQYQQHKHNTNNNNKYNSNNKRTTTA
jgi:hypothetical protein